jgi:hypothetical protein
VEWISDDIPEDIYGSASLRKAQYRHLRHEEVRLAVFAHLLTILMGRFRKRSLESKE